MGNIVRDYVAVGGQRAADGISGGAALDLDPGGVPDAECRRAASVDPDSYIAAHHLVAAGSQDVDRAAGVSVEGQELHPANGIVVTAENEPGKVNHTDARDDDYRTATIGRSSESDLR